MIERQDPDESTTWDRVLDESVFADPEDDAGTMENPFLDPPRRPPGPFSRPAHSTISKESVEAVFGEQQTRTITSDQKFLKQFEQKKSFLRSRPKLGREGESTSLKKKVLGWNTRRREEKQLAKDKKEAELKRAPQMEQVMLRARLSELEDQIERDEQRRDKEEQEEDEEEEARLEAMKRAGSYANKPRPPSRPLIPDDVRGRHIDNPYADDITANEPQYGHFKTKEEYETYSVASHAWTGQAYSVYTTTF